MSITEHIDMTTNSKELLPVVKNTLFLAKSLDDFEGFYSAGDDYNILASRSSKTCYDAFPNAIVWEAITGFRSYSTSAFFRENFFHRLGQHFPLSQYSMFWAYQAYPWTDELQQIGFSVAAITTDLYRKVANKITQFSFLEESSKRFLSSSLKCIMLSCLKKRREVLQTRSLMHHGATYKSISAIMGKQFVVSSAYSEGGASVFLVQNETDFLSLAHRLSGPAIRVEKFIEKAVPINQSGVVIPGHGVFAYQPSIQVLQNIHCHMAIEYTGCDYGVRPWVSEEQAAQATCITKAVGEILGNFGYKGAFGCDYIIDPSSGTVLLAEINPRYQSSSRILVQSACKDQIAVSPHMLHLCSFVPVAPNMVIGALQEHAKYSYIELIPPEQPRGFVRVFKQGSYKHTLRTSLPGIKHDPGLPFGTLYFRDAPCLISPFYPASLDVYRRPLQEKSCLPDQ